MYFDINTPQCLLPETEYLILWPSSLVEDYFNQQQKQHSLSGYQLASLEWPASVSPSEVILPDAVSAINGLPPFLSFTIVFQGNTTEQVDGITLSLILTSTDGTTHQVSARAVHRLRCAAFDKSTAVGAPFKLVSLIGNDLHLDDDAWSTRVAAAAQDSPGRGLHIVALAPGTDPIDAAHSFDALFSPNHSVGECLASAATTTGLWGWMVPASAEDTPSILLLWSCVVTPATTASGGGEGSSSRGLIHDSPVFINLATLQLALCDTFAFSTDTPMRTPLFERLATLLPSLQMLTINDTSMPKTLHVVTMNTSHLKLVDGITEQETDADGVLQSDLAYQLSDFYNEYNEVAEAIVKLFVVRRMSALPIQTLPTRYLNLSTEFRNEAAAIREKMFRVSPKAIDHGMTILGFDAVHKMLTNAMAAINAKLTLSTEKLRESAQGMQLEQVKRLIKAEGAVACSEIAACVNPKNGDDVHVYEVEELEIEINDIRTRAQQRIAKQTMLTASDVAQDVIMMTAQTTELAKEQNHKNSVALCEAVYKEADDALSTAIPKVHVPLERIGAVIENFQVTAFRCRDEIFYKKAKGPAKDELFKQMKSRADDVLAGLIKGTHIAQDKQVALLQSRMDFSVTTLQNEAHLENLRVTLSVAVRRAEEESQRLERERIRRDQQHRAMALQIDQDCKNALAMRKAENDTQVAIELTRINGAIAALNVNEESVKASHRAELASQRSNIGTLKNTLANTKAQYDSVVASHQAWVDEKNRAANSGGGGGGCFGVDCIVVTKSRGAVAARDVIAGDQVLCYRDVKEGGAVDKQEESQGTGAITMKRLVLEWTEVFFAAPTEMEVDVVRIAAVVPSTENRECYVDLTVDHLVTVTDVSSVEKEQAGKHTTSSRFLRAGEVRRREHLVWWCTSNSNTFSTDDGALCGGMWIPVTSIRVLPQRAPVMTILTRSGTILANGIACSCYDGNHTWGMIESLDLRFMYHVLPKAVIRSAAVRKYAEWMDKRVCMPFRELLGIPSRRQQLVVVDMDHTEDNRLPFIPATPQ